MDIEALRETSELVIRSVNGVATKPGAMQLTRIPLEP